MYAGSQRLLLKNYKFFFPTITCCIFMSEQAQIPTLLRKIKDAKRNQLVGLAMLVFGVILAVVLLELAPSFRNLPSENSASMYAIFGFLVSLVCVAYGLGFLLYFFHQRQELEKTLGSMGFSTSVSQLEKKFAENLGREKRQKKTIFSTLTFDNQPLTVTGEVERKPNTDLPSNLLPSLATGWFYFGSQIFLIIENKGDAPVDTDRCKQPIVLNLDVRGVPNSLDLWENNSSNPRTVLDVKDGKIVLDHVRINPGEPLKLLFLAWFGVQASEL
jgi:hypothetical protein